MRRYYLPGSSLLLGVLSFSPLAAESVPATGQAISEVVPTVEVVGGAERLPEIAGSASVIDESELRLSRVFTANEALRKAPGVHVRDEEGMGLRPNIGLRGLNPNRSTKVLLLEDGLPLAYAPYGDNASYYHPPIERFDRIEVLKGSEQILFGPQTVGGVVNYLTPRPPEAFGGRINLAGGNQDYFNGGLRLGGKRMLFDYHHKEADGARDNESTALDDISFKTVVPIAGNQAVTFKASYYSEDSMLSYSGITDAELRNQGYRYNPFNEDSFTLDRTGASLSHEIFFDESLTLISSAYFTHFNRDWWRQSSSTSDGQCGASFTNARLAGVRVSPSDCASTQGRLRSYYTWGFEPRLMARHDLLGVTSELQAGVRAHFETQDRQQRNGLFATDRGGVLAENNARDVNAYSMFVQNRVLLGEFTLTPGVRVEYVDNQRANRLTGAEGETDITEVIPGVGATWNPRPQFTLFAGVHRGFSPPRTEDLIVTASGAAAATFTEVDPEDSWNAEFGFRGNPQPGVRLELAVFRNDFSNQIQVGSIAGGSTPLAQGETLYEGTEFSARLDSRELVGTRHNFYLQSAWTWLPTAEQETPVRQVVDGTVVAGSLAGNRLPYAPEHLATTSIGFTHEKGFDLRLEAVYTAEQFSDFANTPVAAANGNGQVGIIKPALVFNAAATAPIWRSGVSLFVAAKNLLDRDYIVDRTRGIRVGMPLLLQAGVEIEF